MKDLTDVILKDLICDVRLTIVRKVHDERGHPISHEDAMTHMISNKNDYLDVQRRISQTIIAACSNKSSKLFMQHALTN
jgi:hypothetical protein